MQSRKGLNIEAHAASLRSKDKSDSKKGKERRFSCSWGCKVAGCISGLKICNPTLLKCTGRSR